MDVWACSRQLAVCPVGSPSPRSLCALHHSSCRCVLHGTTVGTEHGMWAPEWEWGMGHGAWELSWAWGMRHRLQNGNGAWDIGHGHCHGHEAWNMGHGHCHECGVGKYLGMEHRTWDMGTVMDTGFGTWAPSCVWGIGTVMGMGNMAWDTGTVIGIGHGARAPSWVWDVGHGHWHWHDVEHGNGYRHGHRHRAWGWEPCIPPTIRMPPPAAQSQRWMSTQPSLIAHHVWVAAGETRVCIPCSAGGAGGAFCCKINLNQQSVGGWGGEEGVGGTGEGSLLPYEG